MTELNIKALTHMYVCDDPLIFQCRAVQRRRTPLDRTHPLNNLPKAPEDSEHKGDLLICDMWEEGMELIIYTRSINTDAAS